jgi:hypothetical protein
LVDSVAEIISRNSAKTSDFKIPARTSGRDFTPLGALNIRTLAYSSQESAVKPEGRLCDALQTSMDANNLDRGGKHLISYTPGTNIAGSSWYSSVSVPLDSLHSGKIE